MGIRKGLHVELSGKPGVGQKSLQRFGPSGQRGRMMPIVQHTAVSSEALTEQLQGKKYQEYQHLIWQI